eukprot:scaffold104324_cov16-Tisochrysis_lutea.AAC.1
MSCFSGSLRGGPARLCGLLLLQRAQPVWLESKAVRAGRDRPGACTPAAPAEAAVLFLSGVPDGHN